MRDHKAASLTRIEQWQAVGASRPLGAEFRLVDLDVWLCQSIEGQLAPNDWQRVRDIATRLNDQRSR